MRIDREFCVTNHEGYSCRERGYTANEAIQKAAKRPGYDPKRCTAKEVPDITAELYTKVKTGRNIKC